MQISKPIVDEKSNLQRSFVNESTDSESRVPATDFSNLKRQRFRRSFHLVVLFVLAFWVFRNWTGFWTVSRASHEDRADGWQHSEPFNWSSAPSKELVWKDCGYDRYECARLSVPLDYSNPDGARAAIALVKLPAAIPSSSEEYGGPVLINPGGPGGSGVGTVFQVGKAIQTIIGERFDVIGFDPRGVGLTTPGFNAFPSKNEAGFFYVDYPTDVNSTTGSLGKAYAYSDILGTMLKESSRDVTEYVSTPMVARDMLTIVNASGYDKLQYWGFSYGSVLGATFSAMFPDNVGRIVIDGVVDSEDYYAGLWSNNLLSTDAALLDICDACARAGPRICFLYEPTAEGVLSRVNSVLNKLRLAPIPVTESSPAPGFGFRYGIVSYELAKSGLFLALYNTHSDGLAVLNYFHFFEGRGIGPPLSVGIARELYRALLSCDASACPEPGSEIPEFYGLVEHTLAIACGDNNIEEESFDEVQAVFEDVVKTSSFADVFGIHVACSGWKVKGKERFNGTFNQRTSHPLLLIGNTADPVTPLSNAHKMSRGFEGSVVLTQNASGHCSISATSLCTHKHIRAYFQNGTLPEEGTVCETESKIFYGGGNFLDDIDRSTMTEENFSLLQAARTLQENYFVPPIHVLPRTGVESLKL